MDINLVAGNLSIITFFFNFSTKQYKIEIELLLEKFKLYKKKKTKNCSFRAFLNGSRRSSSYHKYIQIFHGMLMVTLYFSLLVKARRKKNSYVSILTDAIASFAAVFLFIQSNCVYSFIYHPIHMRYHFLTVHQKPNTLYHQVYYTRKKKKKKNNTEYR